MVIFYKIAYFVSNFACKKSMVVFINSFKTSRLMSDNFFT
jgi:hypothetical protein